MTRITSKPIISALSDTGKIFVNDDQDVKQISKHDLMGQIANASAISYDGSGSGITASNVQGAITEVKGKVDALGSPVTYKGSVATFSALPASPKVGDMYNVADDETTHQSNINYAWNGSSWDSMGGTTDMNLYYLKTETDNAINDKALRLQTNFASEYIPSATYAVCAYCTYQNVLYKCTTAIATPEAWTSSHWTAVKVMDEIAYPVGAIYLSVNSTSPASIFGGTWKQIKDTFLLAAGNTYAAGSTGGEAEHKLTIDEMPSHSHNTVNGHILSNETGGNRVTFKAGSDAIVSESQRTTYDAGSSLAHNNMPPYLAVYMWKRVS